MAFGEGWQDGRGGGGTEVRGGRRGNSARDIAKCDPRSCRCSRAARSNVGKKQYSRRSIAFPRIHPLLPSTERSSADLPLPSPPFSAPLFAFDASRSLHPCCGATMTRNSRRVAAIKLRRRDGELVRRNRRYVRLENFTKLLHSSMYTVVSWHDILHVQLCTRGIRLYSVMNR